MSRSYRLYLTDIQRAIERINVIMSTLDETAFRNGVILTDGILFNLMTIGEAAKNIPQHIRDLMPEIDWSEIGKFRDLVAHHYFGLNMNKVWEIVQTDLPELADQIESLMALIKDIDE